MSVLISTSFFKWTKHQLAITGRKRWGCSPNNLNETYSGEEMQHSINICSLLSQIIYDQHHGNALQFEKEACILCLRVALYHRPHFGGHGRAYYNICRVLQPTWPSLDLGKFKCTASWFSLMKVPDLWKSLTTRSYGPLYIFLLQSVFLLCNNHMHNQLTISEIISQANTSHIRLQALWVQKSPLIAKA